MMNAAVLRCDGCGQAASPEHIARRLQRLEWATRYRPVHIGTLLLGAAAPDDDSAFLYAGTGQFSGEAALVLEVAGIAGEGKTREAALAEFQRAGLFLAHVLECAAEADAQTSEAQRLLAERLPSMMARIRRSLRPKRVAVISGRLDPFLAQLGSDKIGCSMVLDQGKAFALDGERPAEVARRLRDALAIAIAAR